MPEDSSADVDQVISAFESYERALLVNDIAALDAAFADSPDVVRFGIADMQHGHAEVAAWRATAAPVHPQRRVVDRWVTSLAPGVVAVDVTFVNGEEPGLGRQSQTWVRGEYGWKIVRAHVSLIPAS